MNTAWAGCPISASRGKDARLETADLTTPSRSQATHRTADPISHQQGWRPQWDPESLSGRTYQGSTIWRYDISGSYTGMLSSGELRGLANPSTAHWPKSPTAMQI